MNATDRGDARGERLRKARNSQLRRGDVGEREPRGADLAGEVGGRLPPELVEEGRVHGVSSAVCSAPIVCYLPCRG